MIPLPDEACSAFRFHAHPSDLTHENLPHFHRICAPFLNRLQKANFTPAPTPSEINSARPRRGIGLRLAGLGSRNEMKKKANPPMPCGTTRSAGPICMSSTNRFIRAQGDLDGACFLYSLANAAQALSGKRISDAVWSKLVRIIHNPQDYLSVKVGTLHTDDNPIFQESLAQQYLNVLSPGVALHANTIHELGDGANPERYIGEKTVLVSADEEHWFCIVDAHDKEVYVACSCVWQRKLINYQEASSERLKRIYNEKFECGKLKYFGHRSILVSKD